MRQRLMTVFGMTVAVLLLCGAAPAAAQTPVTGADIQRLQDNVADASREVSAARAQTPRIADTLQAQLDDLRDEVIYLKVKLRKDTVSRAEYVDLLDRIDRVRSEARRAPSPAPATPAPPPAPARTETRVSPTEIPVGTEFDVRLQSRLNSGTARVEDRFDATTIVPFERNGKVLVPAGSVMRGILTSVTPAGRGVDRKGQVTLSFDRFSIEGRTYSIRATVTEALQGQDDNARIATGAGVGAIIGGILGGFKGALAGILIGGGGTVAATEGKDVDLPAGTVLRVRMDAPLELGQ
jgi:hypothetical protein